MSLAAPMASLTGSTLSLTPTIKLKADASNWIPYRRQMEAYFASNLLTRVVAGTVRMPGKPKEYAADAKLTSEELAALEEQEKKWDEYLQKENQVKEVLYRTVIESVMIKISSGNTTTDV